MSMLKQMVLQARGPMPVSLACRANSSLLRNPMPHSIQNLLRRGPSAAVPRSDAPPRWNGKARLPHSQHSQHSQRLAAAAMDAETTNSPVENEVTATSRFSAREGDISIFEALGVDDRVTVNNIHSYDGGSMHICGITRPRAALVSSPLRNASAYSMKCFPDNGVYCFGGG